MTQQQPKSWETFTHRREDGGAENEVWYQDFGPEIMFKMVYGEGYPCIPVRLVEDPEGDYMGWIPFDRETDKIEMVQRKEIFSIQFPYSVKAAEEAGDGKAVRLRIEELPRDRA